MTKVDGVNVNGKAVQFKDWRQAKGKPMSIQSAVVEWELEEDFREWAEANGLEARFTNDGAGA